MKKVYFCSVCRKVFYEENACACEGENNIKEMKIGTPINVIGTKLKGKVYKIKDNLLEVIITSNKERSMKEYKFEEVRKVL